MKKLLIAVLIVTLALSMLALSACGKGCGKVVTPSEGLEYEFNGKSYSVTVIGSCTDTDIIIPAYYNEKPVTGIGAKAFDHCDYLTSITIPDSVTSIGDYAFEGCFGLKSITFIGTKEQWNAI